MTSLATSSIDRATVQEEARQLRAIWDARKGLLEERGHGSQKLFGQQFGIGNQAAVSFFLTGRVPLSAKAAAAFARGLECSIRDFSPRLADLLSETSRADAPSAPRPLSPVAELARLLEHCPRATRIAMAKELVVLALAPSDESTIAAINALLDPASQKRDDVNGASAAFEAAAIAMVAQGFRDTRDPDLAKQLMLVVNAALVTFRNPKVAEQTPATSPKRSPVRSP